MEQISKQFTDRGFDVTQLSWQNEFKADAQDVYKRQALYTEDSEKNFRKSHQNPYIISLYEEFLGKPMSEKAHHLLHTCYFNRGKEITEQ